MTIPDKIIQFLTRANSVSIGYSEIHLATTDNLLEFQTGYHIGPEKLSYVIRDYGDWEDDWLIIGFDELGDPIFIHLDDPQYPVSGAMIMDDDWDPYLIADSLDNFARILDLLTSIATDRSDPASIKTNPIPLDEINRIVSIIDDQNPESTGIFWREFLEGAL